MSRDELVCRVVLVEGDEECAAEAGAGFGDGATERVFSGTRPARRGESRRAFVGLGPVRAVFVGSLDDAVQQRFFRSSVGVGNDGVSHGAVGAERADRRAHKPGMHYYISGTLSLVPGTLYLQRPICAGGMRLMLKLAAFVPDPLAVRDIFTGVPEVPPSPSSTTRRFHEIFRF